jgi:predicted Zn-dependent peptidase
MPSSAAPVLESRARFDLQAVADGKLRVRELEPVQTTLANGLRVVVVPQAHLQGATLSVFVKVGPRYERIETNGISHFLEHMLFRGTPLYSTPYQLSFAAEALGGTLDAATYADFTHYQISVPGEHAAAALGLLADLLAAPRFSDLALEKNIVKEEILADLDADGREVDAENLSRMLVFGDHPLGFKITGDAANVDRFGLDTLREHMRAHYGAVNMAVVATGAVDPREVFEVARAAFGGLPRGTLTLVEAPPPARHDRRLEFVKNDASQTDVRMLLRAFGSDDPDFVALKLLMRVLDDGMSTRLHQKLTDESGLAYEVFAALDPYEETGLVEIGASVAHDKVPEVLSAMLALLSELRDTDVSSEEFAKARTRYHWNLRRIVDSAEDMALYAGTQAIFGRGIELAPLLAEVERVTCADLRRVARRIVRPENTYVVCVGRIARTAQKQTERVLHDFRLRSRSMLAL